MSGKQTQKVSKVKLNINYIQFLDKVKNEKLLTHESKRLRVEYIESVKVKSALNIDRVNKRVFRTELKDAVGKVSQTPYTELKSIGEKLVEKVRNKSTKYISA